MDISIKLKDFIIVQLDLYSFSVRCKPALGRNVSLKAHKKHKYNVIIKA